MKKLNFSVRCAITKTNKKKEPSMLSALFNVEFITSSARNYNASESVTQLRWKLQVMGILSFVVSNEVGGRGGYKNIYPSEGHKI